MRCLAIMLLVAAAGCGSAKEDPARDRVPVATAPRKQPVPAVPPACVQSWQDPANDITRTRVLPAAVDLPADGLLEEHGQGGCRLRVRTGRREVAFDNASPLGWSKSDAAPRTGKRTPSNVRLFEDGQLQPLEEVAAGAPRPQPVAPAATG